MDAPIKNSWDLRQEILRLRGIEEQQSIALKTRFSSPVAVLSTLYSLFPKTNHTGENRSNIFNQDFVSIISRFLIPITLNKTLFKNSGFLIKALVGLVSQKASGYINEESVMSVFDKVKSLFTKKSDTMKGKYPYSL
jgi:hypothetical protein